MSDERREEALSEARDELRQEPIEVGFTVTCDLFGVPAMSGLEFSATYQAWGNVTPRHGAPRADTYLADPTEYTIKLDGCQLPKWLQEHLATEYASELDAAFLESIGGQAALEARAIQEAGL